MSAPPKLFVSYSWTTPDHEKWVVDLAERLVADGIEVIIDKWDLREGDDAHAFMERMVTDQDIKKVAIIFDEAYVRKANDRDRGVGTETRLITGEIYNASSQNKFVAVIAEKDVEGNACVPAYYKGRIYIDMADVDRAEAEYERLVRWVYDQPLNVRPTIGKKPAFLDDTTHITLGNRSAMKRAVDQMKEGKATASAALDDYLVSVSEGFESLRILTAPDEDADEQVIGSINSFLPTRNEILDVIRTVSRYQPTEENVTKLHRFYERLLSYYYPKQDVNMHRENDFDNFVFVTNELFLYTIAIFLDDERFDLVRRFISSDFYVQKHPTFGGSQMLQLSIINRHVESLEIRNRRLNLKRLSLQADLLKDRNVSSGVSFTSLIQADLVLFLHCHRSKDKWWPDTAIYTTASRDHLPMFARASSAVYFQKIKVLFGVDTPDQLRAFLTGLTNDDHTPRWNGRRMPIAFLTAIDTISTRP